MTDVFDTSFTFRNIESTEALRDHAIDKLEKLKKYLVKQTVNIHVIFKVEGARHLAEITINTRGGRFVGSDTSNDLYTSIDTAVHKIESQLSRNKERIKGHKGE